MIINYYLICASAQVRLGKDDSLVLKGLNGEDSGGWMGGWEHIASPFDLHFPQDTCREWYNPLRAAYTKHKSTIKYKIIKRIA